MKWPTKIRGCLILMSVAAIGLLMGAAVTEYCGAGAPVVARVSRLEVINASGVTVVSADADNDGNGVVQVFNGSSGEALLILSIKDGAGVVTTLRQSETTTAKRSTMTPSSDNGRCQATTKKGVQCKRSASAGSSYCWQHQR